MQESKFQTVVENAFNAETIKKTFRYGSECLSIIHPFIKKPTLWNGAKAVMSLGKMFVDHLEIWPDTYFDSNWTQPYSREFNDTILDVLQKYPSTTLRTADESKVIRIVKIDGAKIGWLYDVKLNMADEVYVDAHKLEVTKKKISELLWEKFKNKPIVLQRRSFKKFGELVSSINFEIDDNFNPLPSKLTTEYSKYLKKCIDAGVSRSVMIYGAPGTGKSTATKAIVENLGLRSFRIRVEDIGDIHNAVLFESIEVFKPEAIIFDDFDRVSDQRSLLETLEFFQRNVKLIVATVNDRSKLDKALLRPGRFDEFIHIKKMDEDVIKHLLGEYVDGFETVKDWPIAYIDEYVKRRKFMSPQETLLAIAELTNRMKSFNNYDDDEDDEAKIPDVKKKSNK
jgi:SpoVK/Ycf46/Vps4 family AAA+-type ATPase